MGYALMWSTSSIMRITTNDGTELFVKEQGTGRPVLMIHGWPLQADTFDDLGLALAEAGLRAIAYDRRGFGRSDQPASGYDYDTMADDLAAIMDELDLSDCTLIGFSMGGGEVARYLSRHGAGRVRDTILISSVVPYMLKTDGNPEGVPGETLRAIAQDIKKDRPHFWAGFFKDFYGVGVLDKPVTDEVLYWNNHMAMQGGLKATLDCATAFGTNDFRPDMASFTVPTLIIHGTADKTVPIDATARVAVKAISNAILKEYPGAAHGLLATHKEEIQRDVLAFITAESTARANVKHVGAMPDRT